MKDKKRCPKCGRLNDITKFCIYCGNRLFSDDEIKLINDTPKPYCLNCGRPIEAVKEKCECGYEFANIKCPECETENAYFNRFCTSCGEKLWRFNVYDYIYEKRLFEHHLLDSALPYDLRNISVYLLNKSRLAKYGSKSLEGISKNLETLKSEDSETDKMLQEICSRWRIASPNYCINCLSILKPSTSNQHLYLCPECGTRFMGMTERVEYLKSEKNYYAKPQFDMPDLKWTSKNKEYYLDSLAPSIGESQLEYRERLKWEFAENTYRKELIKREIDIVNMQKLTGEIQRRERERYERERRERKSSKGGWCGLSCRHCYEEILDSDGSIIGDYTDGCNVEYYCSLGYSTGGFCEHYES